MPHCVELILHIIRHRQSKIVTDEIVPVSESLVGRVGAGFLSVRQERVLNLQWVFSSAWQMMQCGR